ncbi:DUF4062 domain-containing protein [Aquimarina sp. AD10]|uniref:DUF4062 domain-containing protein n=1 Tax=Aquimarina sp. AD10 TaxID=1714849 RepID=UPI000E49A024|nr:DUF4062 domain-containing protein [Aquimarina sp. AD10]AXT63089.1 DUF4062 domain-containing protein [Aquimarina sp. AD10]RKM91593.1 DUF4062 domain-containing protein [Aquimarina sp. AD10]
MAKPRIFLSSTFYDLKYIRAELDQFIENLGYEPIRNEEGDIPYGKEEALEEYCYKEIKNIDILVSIIGGRFGSESKRSEKSISNLELKIAQEESKQVYIFIEKNVLAEYETYLLNKDKDISFRHVDDIRVYKFIEEIKSLPSNNNIKGFETSADILHYLQEQFAGLFQRFLQNQSRFKEVNLASKLENTSKTLNQLVNFLSEQNKENAEEVNRILMINHPLVGELREKLKIDYPIYIEEMMDVDQLVRAKNFAGIDDTDKYWMWEREFRGEKLTLGISRELFDQEDKLKFIKKSDWIDEYIITKREEYDELPF